MLADNYPVVDEGGQFTIVISNASLTAPTGDGWIVFEGDRANVDCAEYITLNTPPDEL